MEMTVMSMWVYNVEEYFFGVMIVGYLFLSGLDEHRQLPSLPLTPVRPF